MADSIRRFKFFIESCHKEIFPENQIIKHKYITVFIYFLIILFYYIYIIINKGKIYFLFNTKNIVMESLFSYFTNKF